MVQTTRWRFPIREALAKRTRKSTQVNASLQNQNLSADLRWWPNGFASQRKFAKTVRADLEQVARQIHKPQKGVNFTHAGLICNNH